MDLYEELSSMSHLLMQLEDNVTPSSYIPVAYNNELTVLNSLRSTKRFVKSLRGKVNTNPLFPVIPTLTSDLINANCVVYNVNIIEEKEKEKDKERRNLLYNSYKIKKGKQKKKRYEDLTARERAHYVPEAVTAKVIPRLDNDGVPIFMKNSSHKQHLIDLQIELDKKEAAEKERKKLLGDRQFNLYDKDGVKFLYDYNGKKLREDKYKPNQKRPISAPAKVMNTAVFKGNILKKTTDHVEHNKTLDIIERAKIHWEPGLLPFTSFVSKSEHKKSQNKAVLPVHYVRDWPEYQCLEDLDIIVTIEHCDGCENHEYFCRHNEEKYLAATYAIATSITEKLSKYRCRYTCIVKPISASGCIIPSLRRKSNIDSNNISHTNIKATQLVLQQQLLSVDYSVRYGAMEIQIAIKKDYTITKHILFSKLLHGTWPTKVLLNKVLSKLIVEFQLDKLKEPMKFNETYVETASITIAAPSSMNGGVTHTNDISNSTAPTVTWIFDGRYKPFIEMHYETETQPQFTYLSKEFMDTVGVHVASSKNVNLLDKFKEELAEKETLEQKRLDDKKEKQEHERAEKEKLEKEKQDKEKQEHERAEKERKEKEKQDKEKQEHERAEKDKQEHERAEKERKEKEKQDKEKHEHERAEKEKQEHERAEKEKQEHERAEKEKLEKEKQDKEKQEHERAEKEKHEKESDNVDAKPTDTKSPDAIINEIKNIVQFNDIDASADSYDSISLDDDKDDIFFNATFGIEPSVPETDEGYLDDWLDEDEANVSDGNDDVNN